jgi:hypothetical protein
VNPWKGLFGNKSEEGKEKTIAQGELEYIGGHQLCLFKNLFL